MIDTKWPSIGANRLWSPEFLVGQNDKISNLTQFINWKKMPAINSSGLDACPNKAGVYAFVWNKTTLGCSSPVPGKSVVYIGKGNRLKKRLDNYVSYIEGRRSQEKRKKITTMLTRCRDDLEVWWTEIPLQHMRAVELALIETIDPYFNTDERIPFDLSQIQEIQKDSIFAASIDGQGKSAFT